MKRVNERRELSNSETGKGAEKAYNPATESTCVQGGELLTNSETGREKISSPTVKRVVERDLKANPTVKRVVEGG